MLDWKKLREDIGKGLKDGIEAIKGGAGVAAEKAGELTTDVKKNIRIHGLKKNIGENMAELGARLYQVEKENPGTIKDVMAVELLQKIDALENELKTAENAK